jgi:hypothetical protein
MFVWLSLSDPESKFFEPAEVARVQRRQNGATANRMRSDHAINVAARAAASSIEQLAGKLGVLFNEGIDAAQ